MNALLDDSLVGLALAVSFLYAFAALGPKKAWRRMLAMLANLLARAPRVLGVHTLAQRLARGAEEKAPSACGGCDNCASEARPATGVHAGEVRVPITSIAHMRRPRQE